MTHEQPPQTISSPNAGLPMGRPRFHDDLKCEKMKGDSGILMSCVMWLLTAFDTLTIHPKTQRRQGSGQVHTLGILRSHHEYLVGGQTGPSEDSRLQTCTCASISLIQTPCVCSTRDASTGGVA